MSYLVTGPDSEFKIIDQRYSLIDPMRIGVHPKNPKDHDIGAIMQSIVANGYATPVMLLEEPLVLFDVPLPQDKDHWSIGGAGRTEAALLLKAKQIPAVILKTDADTAEALILADNEAGRRAGYHEQKLLDALLSRITKYEGDVIGALKGTLFTGEDVDDLIAREKRALEAVNNSPFASFDTGNGSIDPNKFVAFHFGDYHGHVSRSLYNSFAERYHSLRQQGATTNSSGAAMMDDVLRAWLNV